MNGPSRIEDSATTHHDEAPAGRSIAADLARQAIWLLSYVMVVGVFLECAALGYGRFARMDRILQNDAVLGWRLVPGAEKTHSAEERPYRIRVNTLGLRDRDRSYARTPGVRRVIVVGNSYVFGAGGVEQQETFPARLEQQLPDTEFINLGTFGYSTDQQYLYLRDEGLRYRPDVVLLCLSPGDIDPCFSSYADRIGRPKGRLVWNENGIEFQPPPGVFLWDRLASVSHLAALIDRRTRWSSTWYRLGRMDEATTESSRAEAMHHLLGMFRDLAAAAGAGFVVAILPERETKTPLPPDFVARLRDRGLTVIDLPTQSRIYVAGDPFFRKDIHFTIRGHEAIAAELAPHFFHRKNPSESMVRR